MRNEIEKVLYTMYGIYDGDMLLDNAHSKTAEAILSLLEGSLEGKRKILPSEHSGNPMKNKSEEYCMGYNACLEDIKEKLK